jgi:ABC-2 type transport system permease protein
VASTAVVYARIVRSRLHSQLEYRVSFVLDCLSDVVAQATELVAIVVLFGQIEALAGFSRDEVLLLYALAATGFGLADLVVGQVGSLAGHVRAGTLDVMLMRPISALGQVITSDLQLRRASRVVVGLSTLGVILATVGVHWTPANLVLLLVTPLAGATIIGSVWIASASTSFWLVNTQEMTVAVTHGTNLFASYPLATFSGWLRTLMAFVIPSAFVSYYPTLALLRRADPLGGPPWLAWAGPIVALLCALACALIWRVAVRHYQGTGT